MPEEQQAEGPEWQTKKDPVYIVIPVHVEAKVLGKLAVHRMVRTGPSEGDLVFTWTVSHVPTGCAITQHLAEPVAHRLMKALHQLDWNFEREEDMPPKTRERAPKIIQQNTGHQYRPKSATPRRKRTDKGEK